MTKTHTKTYEEREVGVDDIRAASKQLLGCDDIIDVDDIRAPHLDRKEFDKARALSQIIHKFEFDKEFSNGAGLEVISLLISVELLSLHTQKINYDTRKQIVNSIIGKALLHAKQLVDAYERGDIKPSQTRLADGTVVNGEVHQDDGASATRH